MSGGTVVSNNTAVSEGGGIYWDNGQGYIRDALFVDNKSTGASGGGLFGRVKGNYTNPIDNCTFIGNSAKHGGGGAYIGGLSGTDLGRWAVAGTLFKLNKTVSAENWRSGGGVFFQDTVGAFTNCTFLLNGNSSGNGYGGALFTHRISPSRSVPLFYDCRFEGNYATGTGGGGGALFLYDDAFTDNCTFVTNFTSMTGGAVFARDGVQTYKDSLFKGNSTANAGGAIRNIYVAQTKAIGCEFNGNYTTAPASDESGGMYGGAISLDTSSDTLVSNCIFNANISSRHGGGAIGTPYDKGHVYCYNSKFEGNVGSEGGAIKLLGPGGIYGCTFITNSSTGTANSGGGALMVRGCSGNLPTIIANSTFYGNTSATLGGAVWGWIRWAGIGIPQWQPAINVHNSTFYGNSGNGAIALTRDAAEPMFSSVYSTILWTNMNGTVVNDLNGAFSNVVHCIISEPATGYTVSGSMDGTKNEINPLLQPLADNGGPILYGDIPLLTMALCRKSPAIDAGMNELALAYDQRGIGFTCEYVAGLPDVGAFEYIPPPPMNTLIIVQ